MAEKAKADRIGALTGAKGALGQNAGKPSLAVPQTPLAGWKPRLTLDEGLIEVIGHAKQWKPNTL